jgi:hypothetical protein
MKQFWSTLRHWWWERHYNRRWGACEAPHLLTDVVITARLAAIRRGEE